MTKQDNISDEMSVQDLIDELQKVPDKRQLVVACIRGVEVGETTITKVNADKPTAEDVKHHPEYIGVCWLMLPETSIVHEAN